MGRVKGQLITCNRCGTNHFVSEEASVRFSADYMFHDFIVDEEDRVLCDDCKDVYDAMLDSFWCGHKFTLNELCENNENPR